MAIVHSLYTTLIGDVDLTVEAGLAFSDPGFTSNDSFEGDLTSKISITGSVDTNKLGEYTLTYNVSDTSGNEAAEVTRKVTVKDTAAPVITLRGSATATVFKDTAYVDAGASATDSFEGDLTASIVLGGETVDTSTEGVYTLTYNVSDSTGNAAKVVKLGTVEVTRLR